LVYAIYWIAGSSRRTTQNVILLISSYIFYGLWDWRFLSLLLISSLVDFLAAQGIENTSKIRLRKFYLWSSIAWNIGVLLTFKYFNFFLDSFSSLFSMDLQNQGYSMWKVIVPVGLSFYTFQTVSYTIDVYRKKIPATRNALEFFCFVSFFPQLVAGPIERASKLLPQFKKERSFNVRSAKEGLRMILWGLFKKILVADKLGIAVSMVFSEPESYGSITLAYAAVLFSFQMYCDFSGYTDIAIGTAKLFGFDLSKNFNVPYLARSITEFWKRWHITLTRWFTDYVYIPIVRTSKRINTVIRATGLMITMFLVGLWHGPNWTFIAFGVFNGFILGIERIPLFKKKGTLMRLLQGAPRVVTLIYFFTLTSISSIFFRSQDIEQAFFILKRIFSFQIEDHLSSLIGIKLLYLVILIIAELLTLKWEFPLQKLEMRWPRYTRWALYYIIIFFVIRYAEPKEAFIYFQF
jgi:D-alanyl-lipoteichoic acid acyltransferase DltB (MBOAT superfamily)